MVTFHYKKIKGLPKNFMQTSVKRYMNILYILIFFAMNTTYLCTSEFKEWSFDWSFNVTFNDISVIYVTAHRCAGGLKKKLEPTVGLPRHGHFVGFLTCPSKHRYRPNLIAVIPRNRPISVAFHDTHGDMVDLFSSKTPWGHAKNDHCPVCSIFIVKKEK